MPAYVLSMMTIHDPETYRKYTDRTPPVVKKYDGKFLTRGETVTCLEGEEYSGRLVILEFPNKEKVEAWFNGGLRVTLKSGEKLEISRRQTSRFKELMSI